MQFGEHTQSAANCIPPAEVALNLAVGDFKRNGDMGPGEGGCRARKARAICTMKSNSVIVRSWKLVFIRLTWIEMRNWLFFVIHRIGIAIFSNGLMLNLFESLLILLSSDEQ